MWNLKKKKKEYKWISLQNRKRYRCRKQTKWLPKGKIGGGINWEIGIDTHQFSSVQSLSLVWLFATPWTTARQASLSITNSWSLLKLMSIGEKAMAPYSSTVAWKIPWMEEPGRLQSMGSLRVRHDWATSLSLSLSTFMHWRRKWQPTPVFLPGESHGRRSPVGCSPWGCTESDTTEAT